MGQSALGDDDEGGTLRGIRRGIAAVKTHNRGRSEVRVLKIGVWDMPSDEEAQKAFKEYLNQMIVPATGDTK